MSATFQGACFFCGNYMTVRLVAHPASSSMPGQTVQACYDCRPVSASVRPSAFAVVVDGVPYLVEASSRAEAESLLADEIEARDVRDNSEVFWGAQDTVFWIAAWRRKDVVVIQNRKLPDGLA